MRTIIDLTEEQVKALAQIGAQKGLSRAALIRAAVDAYVEVTKPAQGIEAYFGILQGQFGDSVEYQRKLRDEWGR